MKKRHLPLAGALVLALSWAPPAARADTMDQGEARITARSDVTMAIASGPRTTSVKLGAVAKHLGTPLGTIKRCYGDLVKEDPSVAGHLDVQLTFPEKGPLAVSLEGAGVASKSLRRCVGKAFGAVKLEEELRPARAVVKLDFTNTAADAATDVQAHREQAQRVEVRPGPEGGLYSEDGTADGKVRFRVEGSDADAIERVHGGVAGALPRLLDCRRRAGKRQSPAGQVTLRVKLPAKGAAKVDATGSTVAHPNAKTCSQTALRRARFEPGTPASAVVVVEFREEP